MDKNKDGYITFKELLKGLGDTCTEEEATSIMENVDTDNNGAIDYSEFLAATLDAEIAKNLKKLEIAFQYFDQNKDGVIDAKELKKALDHNPKATTDTEGFKKLLEECDTVSTGKMNYKEFLRCMSVYTEHRITRELPDDI